MNSVRERVLIGMQKYDFNKTEDLVLFTVGSDYLEDWEECEPDNGVADFDTLVVVTEKEWLFDLIRKSGISDPENYYKTEYTWDDSYEWFIAAKEEAKIVMVTFI